MKSSGRILFDALSLVFDLSIESNPRCLEDAKNSIKDYRIMMGKVIHPFSYNQLIDNLYLKTIPRQLKQIKTAPKSFQPQSPMIKPALDLIKAYLAQSGQGEKADNDYWSSLSKGQKIHLINQIDSQKKKEIEELNKYKRLLEVSL